MRRLTLRTIGVSLGVVLAASSSAQDVEVKGAQIILQPKEETFTQITIENRRKSPLVVWQIGLSRADAGGVTASADFSLYVPHSGAKSGPLQPNEQRTIDVKTSGDYGSPRVKLAVFEDGHIEGDAEAIAQWQDQRRQRADDAAYWVRAFDSMPTTSPEDAKKYLAARVAERAAQSPSDPSGIRNRLSVLWRLPAFQQPPDRLFDEVVPIRREAAFQVAILTHQTASPARLEAETPLLVSSKPLVLTDYVAVIKNLREVPIEAVGFEIREPGETRASSGISMDFLGSDRTRSDGGGRIAPGESREFPLHRRLSGNTQVPVLRITFVMFDDLLFEGDQANREMLAGRRKEQADDIEFLIAVRNEAATKSPAEALDFLAAKRAERIAALETQGRIPSIGQLDGLIGNVKRSPEHLRDPALVQDLERRREELRRHLKR